MAKKTKETPTIRYESGRWITGDGLAFNTQAKAEEWIQKNQNKNNDDGAGCRQDKNEQ